MKYKISDSPLRLREYGRNIQSMVEYARNIKDREERTKVAHEIVRIMSHLNPSLKDIPDYKQKLWDHLRLISHDDLDVDYPYPPPPDSAMNSKKRMEYYRGRPRYRQYGWNTQLMVKAASEMEDGPEKSAFINMIANTMNMFLKSMNRDSIPESVIAEHIRDLSNGKLDVRGEDLTLLKVTANFQNQPNNQKNHRSSSKRNRGGKRKRR